MASRRPLKITNQDDEPKEGGVRPGIAESDCESEERNSSDSGSGGVVKRYVDLLANAVGCQCLAGISFPVHEY